MCCPSQEERARAEREQAAKAAADEQRREDEVKRRSNERDQHRVSLGLAVSHYHKLLTVDMQHQTVPAGSTVKPGHTS